MATEPDQSDAEVLVVSLNESARDLWYSRQDGILKRQSIAAIVLGGVWLVMILATVGSAAFFAGGPAKWWGWLLVAALPAIPVWLVAQGLMFVRRPARLQLLQLTVTEDEVIIPEHFRLTVVDRHRPELRWRREEVRASVVPANGLFGQRLRLDRDGSRTLARYWETRYLDVPAQSIVEAIARR